MESIAQAATLYRPTGAIPTADELGGVPLAAIGHLVSGTWRSIEQYAQVCRDLQRFKEECAECMIGGGEDEDQNLGATQVTVEIGETSEDGDEVGLEGIFDPHRRLLATSWPFPEGQDKVGESGDENNKVDGAFNTSHAPATFEPAPEGQEYVVRKAVANRTRSEIQAYQFAQPRGVGLRLKFQEDFDDYHTGPTEERVAKRFTEVRATYATSPDTGILDTMYIRFDDQGYRRTAGGFHHFYNNAPSIEEQLVHFFPTPPENLLKERKNRLAAGVNASDLAAETIKGPFPASEIHGNDLLVWSLDDMVEKGGVEPDTQTRPYITGRCDTTESPNNYIRFDPLLSRKTVEDVRISMDIDSVIWLTDKLKVRSAINVHLLPTTAYEAPISSDNHTFVELYSPRTNREKTRGKMREHSSLTPISTIPNMHFAHAGKAEGHANITIMFPRMKHKNPLRNRWETTIPYEVQVLWFQKVLYPALHEITEDGVGVYTQGNLEDTQFKFGGSKEKTLQIQGPHLTTLVANIHRILDDKQGNDYDSYRSFFFVLDIRGIKASTTCDENSLADPWATLLEQHPSLDWEHMENSDNGELFIDIGCGFHPPENSGMVGFWSMDALQVGFEYGGYGAGTHHTVDTVAAIGGTHASMPVDRRLRTHILYRLAYNLSYEVLRGHKTRTKTGFFPARSAYHVDRDFLNTVEGVVSAYERSLQKSYGVRDEYRCRASSAKRLLPFLRDKAKDYLHALDPIVWLSSEKWFTFVMRRLGCLARFQERLSRFRPLPPNYGSLTNVLAYLIQCVGITPIVKDRDLRDDLRNLRLREVSERFGCFFLQNLDLSNAELPDINGSDPPGLLRRMGVKPIVQTRQKRALAPKPPTLPTADCVTWPGLRTLITMEDKRAKILPFQFDPAWAAFSVAQNLFCRFTYEWWKLVTTKKFVDIHFPVTLKAAMESWTLESVRARMKAETNYDLTPSADGLLGAVPTKSRTQIFRNKRIAFFPEPGSAVNNASQWRQFFKIGYVKAYHDALGESTDGGKGLRDALDNIFERLRVLPRKPPLPSSHKTLWVWEGGRMNLLLNSTYIQLPNRNILPTTRVAKGKRNTGPRNTRSKAQMDEILLAQKHHSHPKQTKALRKVTTRKLSAQAVSVPREEQMAKGKRRGKAKGYREPPKRQLLSPSPKPAGLESEHFDNPGSHGGPLTDQAARVVRFRRESQDSDAGDADSDNEDHAAGGEAGNDDDGDGDDEEDKSGDEEAEQKEGGTGFEPKPKRVCDVRADSGDEIVLAC